MQRWHSAGGCRFEADHNKRTGHQPWGAFPVSIVGVEPEWITGEPGSQNVLRQGVIWSRRSGYGVIGKGLADAMAVTVGDRITLTGQALHEQMRNRTMTIAVFTMLGFLISKSGRYISPGWSPIFIQPDWPIDRSDDFTAPAWQETAVIGKIGPCWRVMKWIHGRQTSQNCSRRCKQSSVMKIFSVIILLISGIGILNLLLMAVFERTREIGILGALGLRPRQISLLFILEGRWWGGCVPRGGLGLALTCC